MSRFKSFSWRSLKPLLWAGPVILTAGLVSGFVSGSWGNISTGLIVVGGVICLVGLLTLAPRSTFWGKRSTQASSNALIATLSVILILGLINFIAARYNQRLDLTENQLFTLAPQSQQVVKSLKQSTKVWVFTTRLSSADQGLLNNLKRENPDQFKFELVDPQAQPTLAKQFQVNAYGDVYLESNQRKQFVQSLGQGEPLSESKLVNALAKLGSGEPTPIYFLQGHGEHPLEATQGGLSQAVQGLEAKNFMAKPLDLAQTRSIPADAKILVIAGAKRALLPTELENLSAFSQKGGSLLILIDPGATVGLDPFLKTWGVKLDNALVVDPAGQAAQLGPAVALVNQYGTSPITQDFGNGYSLFPLSRPLETEKVPDVTATPLFMSSAESWAETDLKNTQLRFDPNQGDRKGPLILGLALSRPLAAAAAKPTPKPTATPSPTPSATDKPEESKPETRLVVIGTSQFPTNGLFQQQLNGDVFLNSVSWLSQSQDAVLSIRPKEAKNRRLTITAGQGRLLVLVAVILMPLLAFGAAILLWWRRR